LGGFHLSRDYGQICRYILSEHGPLLGSELQHLLIQRANVKANNARQIILRLRENKTLLCTEPVKFTKNQLLYFLPKQNINKKLLEVIPDHAQTFHRLYQALCEQDGFLLWSEFCKISSGVIDKETNQNKKSVYEIYLDMRHLGLLQEIEVFNQTQIVIANDKWVPRVDASYPKVYQRLRETAFNKQITGDLLKWLEKMNIAGYNATYLTEDEDWKGYNGYYWDAIAYSYLWGLYKTNKRESTLNPSEDKTGSLILVESIIHREMKLYDLSGFISRVGVLQAKLQVRDNFRIIPVCFVQSMEEEALKLARKRGIMIISVTEVFGSKLAETLKTVRNLDPRNIDAEALVKVLEAADASGHDGKLGSLKGYVFNFLVTSIFNNFGFSCKMGVKYDFSGEKCECDVWISVDEEYLIVCEAKGYNEGNEVQLGEHENDKDTVKKFFERTCRIVSKASGKEVLPVFITSGSFSNEALEYLQKKNESKKIKRLMNNKNFPGSVYYDRNALFDLFANKQLYSEHKKILKEFFRDHKK